MTESKSVVLPLHYTSTVWSEMKDSNLRSSAPKADGLNQTFLISDKRTPKQTPKAFDGSRVDWQRY